MADFDVDISAWVDKAIGKTEQALQEIALAAVQRVQELTPVDTGNLRANWVATVGGTAIGTPAPADAKPINAKLGDVIEIVNPVVYARRIEYGFVGVDRLGRRYNQAGRGMVAQTIAEMPQIADAVIKRISSE